MGRYTMTILLLGMSFGVAAISSYYFIQGEFDSLEYTVMMLISGLFVLMSIYFMRGVSISVDTEGIRIRSPFLDAIIPMSSVSSVEFRQTFSPGIRVFGYGGVKKISGVFRNSEFSRYRACLDTSITGFVVIRYGEDKVLVFNSVDSPTTYNMYSCILSASKKD